MLYLLLLYVGISSICLLTGILFFECFSPGKNDKPFIVYTITGLIVLTVLAQWTLLLMPLTSLVQSVIIILPVILFIVLRKRISPKLFHIWRSLKNQWPPLLVCFCCFLFMILTINAGPVAMDDTETYHMQMVKWLREYGTVPGLANLHLRYGFNSSWFSSVGLLTPQTGAINSYLVLNGLISAWFCHYLVEKLQQLHINAQYRMRHNFIFGIFFVAAAALIAWPLIRGNATNMNYDFITTVCVFVLFLEAILTDKFSFGWEWVVWPCFLFTVRIINYPVLLLALYAFIISFKNYRLAFGYVMVSIILIAPFIARNVLLSGYPLFPVYQVDLFSVDWKADRQMTVSIVDYIKYFNRVNVMFKPMEETKAMEFPYWIPEWFRYLFASEKPAVVAGLAGLAAGLVFLKRLMRRISGASIFFLVVMLTQLVSWFFTAPDPRFVFGPLLCGLLIPFILFPPLKPRNKIILASAVLLLSAGLLAYSTNKIIFSPQHKNFMLPCDIPHPPTETIEVDGIRMQIPEKINNNWNRRCYDTQLPCLYRVHPGLRARGKQLSDGFYIQPGTYSFDKGVWY
jgi:hypothetical protein